ncbi:hypothetical protein DFP73DRAFT_531174 [Morchella snyderi]|nr:hypothetical protein DFP73DRAFT_531174 [Morchella snyderi]
MYPKALLAFLITFLLLFTTLASPALNVRQDESVTMVDDGDTSETEDASESQETTTVTSTIATATAAANGTTSSYSYVVATRDPYQIWFYQHKRTLWCSETCCNVHIRVGGAYAVGAPRAVLWSSPGCTGRYTVLSCGAVYLSGSYHSMSEYLYYT